MGRIGVLVTTYFQTTEPRPPEEVEEYADRVLDLLEDEFDGIAVGPVVGCDLRAGRIEIRYSVDGADSAEIHRTISQISERLDELVGGRVQTAMAPAEQAEAACV